MSERKTKVNIDNEKEEIIYIFFLFLYKTIFLRKEKRNEMK